MYLTLCGNNDTVLILSLLTEIKCNSASDSFTTLALYKFTYLLTYLLTKQTAAIQSTRLQFRSKADDT